MTNVQKIAEAENTELDVAVNDNRHNKDRVGRKINGYGMPMALIVCDNDVSTLVKEALLKELDNRGFTLSPQNPQILINVELNKLSNRFRWGFWAFKSQAETNLTITIQNPDGTPKYTKTFLGQAEKSKIFVASGKNAQIPLEQSLQHVIAQIVEDPEFLSALLKTPQITLSPADTSTTMLSEEKAAL